MIFQEISLISPSPRPKIHCHPKMVSEKRGWATAAAFITIFEGSHTAKEDKKPEFQNEI